MTVFKNKTVVSCLIVRSLVFTCSLPPTHSAFLAREGGGEGGRGGGGRYVVNLWVGVWRLGH